MRLCEEESLLLMFRVIVSQYNHVGTYIIESYYLCISSLTAAGIIVNVNRTLESTS